MGSLSVRAYPDSCILIYLIDYPELYGSKIRERIQPPQGAFPTLVFTELTRLECRLHPLRHGNSLQLQAFDRFFSSRGYEFQPTGRPEFELATQLRAEHALKTADALHLAAAICAGCDEFWSNDSRLAKAAQNRLQIVTFESTP